jgi:hypothetical protein
VCEEENRLNDGDEDENSSLQAAYLGRLDSVCRAKKPRRKSSAAHPLEVEWLPARRP